MHVNRDAWDEEKGTSLVIVTITLVVLMAFAALAVDLAHAWSQRRQDQSAADTAGVAGAIFTAEKLRAQAIADASAEVIRISKQSLNVPLTDAEWATEWLNCSDPTRPALYSTVSPVSPCISFNDNLQQMRVRTPEIDVDTAFGNVIGVDTITTDAVAVVRIDFNANGGAMPFGLPGMSGNETHVCLKTGPNPSTEPPCDGPDTGNFGFLDITQFGSIPLGTTHTCTGNNSDRLARNIAQGVDHPIRKAPSAGASFYTDRTACNEDSYNVRPYTLTVETGNMTGAVDDGFIVGVDGIPGRLTLGGNTTTVAGDPVDDTPLWTYLNGAGQTLCGTITTHDQMINCLANVYDPVADGVIFDLSIREAPRFGWVPLFYDWTLGAGSGDHNIEEFRTVYIQTTFWKCNNSGCRFIHDPGEPIGGTGGGPGNVQVEASSAIQIPLTALPDVIVKNGPGSQGQVVYTIIE